MRSFRIMTSFLLALPLAASAGSYSPKVEKNHLITQNQTYMSDVFTTNLEAINNPSTTNLIPLARGIKPAASKNPRVRSDARQPFAKSLGTIYNPSITNMLSKSNDIKSTVSKNPVALSDSREVFTTNLEKIQNPSIAKTISQTVEIKYVISQKQ